MTVFLIGLHQRLKKISKKGYLSGIDDDDLGLTKNMIRILVILDKAGVFGD